MKAWNEEKKGSEMRLQECKMVGENVNAAAAWSCKRFSVLKTWATFSWLSNECANV